MAESNVCYDSNCKESVKKHCGKSSLINSIQPSIVGGDDAISKEFPWHAAIYENGIHMCGGSLISQKFILSAHHCFDPTYIKLESNYFVTVIIVSDRETEFSRESIKSEIHLICILYNKIKKINVRICEMS